MATPLSADRLLKALRDEGLTVDEVRNWRTHNRNSKGPWGPVNGVMIHHTVTSGTASSVELCYDGHARLPGPLCHGVIAKDGAVHLVGYGRANHAGLGDDDVLRAVIAETRLPPDNEANTDGNRHFYGFECDNLGDGKDPWPEAQLEAIEKVSAAICRAHGWSERSVIGHLEWQPGKVDPRGFTMDSMRTRIGKRLGKQAGRPDRDQAEAPGDVRAVPGRRLLPRRPREPGHHGHGQAARGRGLRPLRGGPGPGVDGRRPKSYAAWQRKLGFSGDDADGIPGKKSWDKLHVPNV